MEIEWKEWEGLLRKRYEKFADWCERGALIAVVSMVVQQIIEGAPFTKRSVVVGLVAAVILYYAAYRLMKRAT